MSKFDKDSVIDYSKMAENVSIVQDRSASTCVAYSSLSVLFCDCLCFQAAKAAHTV